MTLSHRHPLTPRQLTILAYLRGYYAEHGYPPTVREMTVAARLRSTASTSAHLAVLVGHGKVRQRHGHARGYFPVDEKEAA